MFKSVFRMPIVLAGAVILSACAGGPSGPRIPIPEDPGLYAMVSQDELRRLDGSSAWEVQTWNTRADLSPAQQFVLYDPILASRGVADVDIELWQVAWVRSAIRDDGSAAPIQGSQWAVAPLEQFRVPHSLRAVGDHADMVNLVPQGPLAPGLYSLQIRQGAAARSARFGVQWSSIDKQDYSANHCVDRRTAGQPAFRSCGDQSAAAIDDAARDFRLSLVDPVKMTIGGERVLIIQGTITNEAATARALPMLEATLQDSAGTVLHRWPVTPQQSQLAPGETTSFRTEVRQPPATTARVNVNFAADLASGQL